MSGRLEASVDIDRRHFFSRSTAGLGVAAMASLLGEQALAADGEKHSRGLSGLPHFAPKAKRVIYLFQSGAPSQMDLFDYKPALAKLSGTELPDSIRRGQRLTGMTSRQASFPIAPSKFQFARRGECGAWVSELMPHTAQVVDDLCFIKSMHTEAINHDPAITFFQTGAQLAGRPSMGAWLSYGLGSENRDLPAFVAMVSQGTGRSGQPLYDRLWGSGFLPTKYQGVKFRSVGDPVLYLSNPPGLGDGTRRRVLDDLARLNRLKLEELGDPEIATRIAQYELAYGSGGPTKGDRTQYSCTDIQPGRLCDRGGRPQRERVARIALVQDSDEAGGQKGHDISRWTKGGKNEHCDPNDDSDGDGVCGDVDICSGHDDNADDDGDGVPDGCDQCPGSDDGAAGALGDEDGDGVLNCNDECPGIDDAVFAPDCAGAIPATSEWGLVVLALLLLVGIKISFARRRPRFRTGKET